MIIKLENYRSYYKDNMIYNSEISAFISELFQTNNTGRIQYIISDLENFNLTKRHNYYNNSRKEYLRPQEDINVKKNYAKYKTLGPLEYSLASYILNPNLGYNVIILSGALGSGKSSLSNYTLDYIKSANLSTEDPLYFPKEGTIHKINFNENFSSNNKEDIVYEFLLIMVSKLSALVQDIHKKELFIESFIDEINTKPDDTIDLDLFSEYVRKLGFENYHTEEQKFNFLLNWLETFTVLSVRLRMLSYILTFIKKNRGNKQVDFIILFDNIDRFEDDVQIDILNILFGFSVSLPIKLLVPMRLTTFGKVKGNGSYSYAILQNTGHPPIRIFSERVKHFLNNKDEYDFNSKISKDYQRPFLQKFEFLSRCLNDNINLNRVTSFHNSIAGNSIRRGLFLSERFFINSAFSYNDEGLFQEDFLKALLVCDSEHSKLANDDRLVNNIFASADNSNTLLKIRILQILSFFRENNWTCKISTILSQLKLFEGYSNEDILLAIDDLISYAKRLIYIEGVKGYSDVDTLMQSSNDIIQITYSGSEYLNTLVNNPVYLQCVFATLNWKVPASFKNMEYLKIHLENILADEGGLSTNHAPFRYLHSIIESKKTTITGFVFSGYDYKDINERMKFLRNCLYFLMVIDINELMIYFENNTKDGNSDGRYINSSIIIDVITKVSVNVLNILKGSASTQSELGHWHSLLIIIDLWQKTIYDVRNRQLENMISQYTNEINGTIKFSGSASRYL